MDLKQFQKIMQNLAIGGLEPVELKATLDALIDGFDELTNERNDFKDKYDQLMQEHEEQRSKFEEQKGELTDLRDKYHKEFLKSGDGEDTPVPEKTILSEEEVIKEFLKISEEKGAE